MFLAFIALMCLVDHMRPVEFRSPARTVILLPYLALFFGSILLIGWPMFRLNRSRSVGTLATSVLLIGSIAFAMLNGVG